MNKNNVVASLRRLITGARDSGVPVLFGPMAYTEEDCADEGLRRRSGINRLKFEARDRNGRRTRIYDKPTTPLDRLLAADVLAPAQAAEFLAYRDSLNPAAIGREIADLQAVLLRLAKVKTEQLYLATFPSALPDVRAGIRINKPKAS